MHTLSIKYFREEFKSQEDCYTFLMEQKWGSGFNCSKCGCINWYKGGRGFYGLCNSCYYIESARAYAKVIDKGSSEKLKPFFADTIDKDCIVNTDCWRGCLLLKKDWDIQQ